MDVSITCACPVPPDGQARHPDGDTVTLHEPMSPRVRRALLYDLGLMPEDATVGDKLAALSEGYLLHCIDAWTVLDAKGKPLPPSRENITALLLEDTRGDAVTKAADDLYSEAVLLPLFLGASSSSSAGPTDGSTSQDRNGKTPHRKRSTRSSITSIPMAVTGPMQASSGGGSSS